MEDSRTCIDNFQASAKQR